MALVNNSVILCLCQNWSAVYETINSLQQSLENSWTAPIIFYYQFWTNSVDVRIYASVFVLSVLKALTTTTKKKWWRISTKFKEMVKWDKKNSFEVSVLCGFGGFFFLFKIISPFVCIVCSQIVLWVILSTELRQ